MRIYSVLLPPEWQEARAVLQPLYVNGVPAFIRGGMPRDMYAGRDPQNIKDADVVTWCRAKDVARAFGQMPYMTYGFHRKNTIHNDDKIGWKVSGWIGRCKFIHTYRLPGIPRPVQVMGIDRKFSLEGLLRDADFGINQIATDGIYLYYTDAFLRDYADNRLVLRSRGSRLKRIERCLRLRKRLGMRVDWLSLLLPKT